jgi:hypothetical protein
VGHLCNTLYPPALSLSDAVTLSLQSVQYTLVQVGHLCNTLYKPIAELIDPRSLNA